MRTGIRLTGLLFLLLFSELWAGAIDLRSSYAPVSARSDSTERNACRVDAEKSEYHFSYKDDSLNLVYTIAARDPSTVKGMISVRVTVGGSKRLIPIFQGGPIIQEVTGPLLMPSDAGDGRTIQLTSHELNKNEAVFQFEEKIKAQVMHRAFRFSIRGKTLIMEATGDTSNSDVANYCGFDLGKSRLTESPVIFRLPSSPLPAMFVDNQFFISTYVDPYLSTPGRYEFTEELTRNRFVQASNTPAWLLADGRGKRPQLDVIAYLTLSDRILDVLPSTAIDAGKGDNPIRDKVVIDVQQAPFTSRPYLPVETIRRWEAPESGKVHLEGTFQLNKGQVANCSAILKEAAGEKEWVLLSQILDVKTKTAAGMKGDFPVKQGDQLLFSLSGPDIMDGGEVLMDVRMDFEGESYSSYEDFSDQQGQNGWYYEQRIGNERTLMVWNPDLGQWESPFTRSLQTAASLICRSGAASDVFETARQFFQELRWMGLANLGFLIRDWSDRARIAPPPDTPHNELAWGSVNCLQELSQQEEGRGNLFIPVVSANQLGLPDASGVQSGGAIAQLTSLLQGGIVNQSVKALQEYLSGVNAKMRCKGLWLEAPAGFDRFKSPELLYQLAGISPSASYAAREEAVRLAGSIHASCGGPLLLEWRDLDTRLDAYARSFFDGVAAPLFKDSTALSLVDEEIFQGRKNVRIGFGSYEGFFQGTADGSWVDLRMFPLDQYMTSLLVYGRVPLISGRVWSAGMSGRDMRKYLMETVCLLQPIAREYLGSGVAAKSVCYRTQTNPSEELTVEEVFSRKLMENVDRVSIEYSNGLRIHANRSMKPWLAPEESLPLESIAGDGFMALNQKTGLFAMISQQGDRPFSVRRTPESFFLNSRSGGLVRYELFSVDGMMHRWKNRFTDRADMACLGVTEANYIDPALPILRANRRIDCCVEWKSDKQVDIHLLQADESPVLLEFFDIPRFWGANEGKNLTIACYDEGNEQSKEAPKWYITTSGGVQGVRFVDIHSGDRYSITYGGK